MDPNAHTVLCIDDEQNILNALKRLLRKEQYRLLTANSGREGLAILAENEVHVVISDQRMPEMNGTEFLKKVRETYPNILRIILTGYTDVDTISEAINEGHIYKFFLKPWNDHNLKLEIRQALEQYDLIQANKQLHDQLYHQNDALKKMNENLEAIVHERTQSLEVQNQALQISRAILDDLPLPILGVSSEMLVVMANKAALQCLAPDQPLEIGGRIDAYFEDAVQVDVKRCFEAMEKGRVATRSKTGAAFELEMIPLTGRYRGQGLIMTLHPAEK